MKILFLSNINSAHIRKWAASLAEKGFEIGIFSLGKPEMDWFSEYGIKSFNAEVGKKKFSDSLFSKVSYLKAVPQVKKIIKEFKPDILHAHYATSYGLIGVRTKFRPYIISCWGSDVMDFPRKSFVHKLVVKRILSKADKIFVTSKTIEKYIHQVIKKEIVITPFGIDTEVFKPMKVKSIFSENDIVIGTIKSLEKNYCIDVLIQAFAKVKNEYKNLNLLMVGEGAQEKELKSLVQKLKIEKDVVFTGKIDYSEIPHYHNMIDIFVNVSEHESFGVSVLEAMACAKPVIVSDTGGLAEIVKDDSLGLKVPVKNVAVLSEKLKLLVENSKLRKSISKNANEYVLKNYDWKKNLELIISEYKKIAK